MTARTLYLKRYASLCCPRPLESFVASSSTRSNNLGSLSLIPVHVHVVVATHRFSSTNKRRRSRFDINDTNQVPSFRDFQQHHQVKSLYRKFLRLVKPLAEPHELQEQIRREFRASRAKSESWQTKRELAEGMKRYKELSAMLLSIPSKKMQDSAQAVQESSSAQNWPWQRDQDKPHQMNHLPPKSLD